VSYKGGPQGYNGSNTTYEHRRALGLCHKCNEKYFSGHKFISRLLNLIEIQKDDQIESEDDSDKEEMLNELATNIEEAVV
jgi:hypothetical protein